ncbi:MAG: molybdopterin-dependent oxidoreductase [Dehalococcoidia bacterium]
MLSRGFSGFRRPQPPREIPSGQYYETGFPVLTYGPTERVSHQDWAFTMELPEGELKSWNWDDLLAMPQTDIHTDIHCVTKWSMLDSDWKGVDMDVFFDQAGVGPEMSRHYLMVRSFGGYTTNLPVADVRGGKAFIVHEFDGEPITQEHGGPVRMIVPHLYFWKSAKWVESIRFMKEDAPGFWETNGYHMYGDPWKEQRYWGD